MSPSLELQDAKDRIDRLERKLRMQGRGALALGILVVITSLLAAQTAPMRTVEAERFILRGAQGNELASLSGDDTGAALTLYDGQHQQRATLRSGSEVSGLSIDNAQKGSVVVGSSSEGSILSVQGNDLKSGDLRLGVGLSQYPVARQRTHSRRIRSYRHRAHVANERNELRKPGNLWSLKRCAKRDRHRTRKRIRYDGGWHVGEGWHPHDNEARRQDRAMVTGP